MAEKIKEFNCKSKQIADYLIKHNSKLLRVDDGIFVFKYDDSIDNNLSKFEIDYKRCMF